MSPPSSRVTCRLYWKVSRLLALEDAVDASDLLLGYSSAGMARLGSN
jgi:hypothetical protein